MFVQLKKLIANRRLYLRTVEELSGLNDHELRDLSITRGEIRHVAHRAAYGVKSAATKAPVASTATNPAANRRAFA